MVPLNRQKSKLNIKVAEKAFEKKEPAQKNEKKINELANEIDKHASKQLQKQIDSLSVSKKNGIPQISTDISKKMSKKFVDENISLIKSLDKRFFDDIEAVISESVKIGRSTKATAKLLQERYHVSKSRAELIAVDQISKLNGLITQQKQQEIGIKKYEWGTAGDERVRPTHRQNDGKTFSWSKPPKTGHPGQDIRCRCVALPIFD